MDVQIVASVVLSTFRGRRGRRVRLCLAHVPLRLLTPYGCPRRLTRRGPFLGDLCLNGVYGIFLFFHPTNIGGGPPAIWSWGPEYAPICGEGDMIKA